MMPNFQPTPHECDLPAPEGVRSDLDGGESLSRGGGSESGLGGLTGALACRVHGSEHVHPAGPEKNARLTCVECENEAHYPERVTIRELRAEIAALKQDVSELEIHLAGQGAVNDQLSDKLASLRAATRPGGPLKPLGEMIKAVPSEVEQLKADLDTALGYVEDAVNQACQITEATGEIFLDTMCSGTWESACDYLHRLGRVTEILPGRIYAFPWMVEKNAKGATKGAENG